MADFPQPSQVPAAVQRQQQAENRVATDFFVYNAIIATLTAGTTQTANIQIQADSDFEIQKLTALVMNLNTAPDVNTHVDNISVLITDTGTGRQLSDIAVPIQNMFGTAQLPFILPNTKIMKARSILAIQVSNAMTAYDYANIKLSFIGRKIFRGYQ